MPNRISGLHITLEVGIGFRPIKLLEHPENLYNYPIAPKSPQQKIIGIRTDFRRYGECEDPAVNAI